MNPIEQITIQKNYSSGGYGETENWKTFCQVYAEIQIGNGRQFFGAKRINNELSGLVRTIQFIKGITPDMRIIHPFHGTFEIMGPPRNFPQGVRDENANFTYFNELHLRQVV
jgi:head-tail adaptor